MKKSLIALVVVSAASYHANAAEIYSLDGVTINLGGEVDVQYYKDQEKSEHSEWNINEASFGFNITYEMTESLVMGAHLDVNANNGEDDSVTRGDVYGLINIDRMHTITFGSQSTILDDAGIGTDYSFGFTSFIDRMNVDGDQVVKYKYDGGSVFYGGLSYLEHRNDDTGNYYSDDYQVDGNIGARVEDFEFTLYASNSQTKDLDGDTYIFETRYTYGDWKFAGTVGRTTTQISNQTEDKTQDIYGLTASYFDGGRMMYGAGWANIDTSHSPSASKNQNVNDLYVNVAYLLSRELKVYGEVGFTDESNMETGYVVGLDATF